MEKELTLTFILNKKMVLNANKKLHYMVHGKIVKSLRELAAESGDELSKKLDFIKFEHFKVSVIICPPTRRRLDPPNLYPTIKAITDGLTDSGWWEDDDFKHLLELSFRYGGLSGERDTFKIIYKVQGVNPNDYVLESEIQ